MSMWLRRGNGKRGGVFWSRPALANRYIFAGCHAHGSVDHATHPACHPYWDTPGRRRTLQTRVHKRELDRALHRKH